MIGILLDVRKGDTYSLPSGARTTAVCNGLVVDGRLIPSERCAAHLNTVGGYGKVKRRSEAPNEPAHPGGS